MSDVIVNAGEAHEEARRLTKVHGRDVEAITRNCCDYDSSCGCGGQGYRYDLVFAFCEHSVGDGDGEECHAKFCLERERDSLDREPRKQRDLGLAKPLLSIRESAIEEMVDQEDAEVLV